MRVSSCTSGRKNYRSNSRAGEGGGGISLAENRSKAVGVYETVLVEDSAGTREVSQRKKRFG